MGAAKLGVSLLALCLCLTISKVAGNGAVDRFIQPCSITHYPILCSIVLAQSKESLTGDDRVFTAVAVGGVIKAANKATYDITHAKDMFINNPPVLFTLSRCRRNYVGTVAELRNADLAVKRGDFVDAKTRLAGASKGVTMCNSHARHLRDESVKKSFYEMNKHVGKMLNIALSFAVRAAR